MNLKQRQEPVQLGNFAPEAGDRNVAQVMIEGWTADPAMNTLRRGAQVVHLEPKAMELLVFLARRAQRVVSRDQLLSGVWPGLVVGDDALTQAIIKLRKALGDNPRKPTYIQTVPKRGYRLIAPVAAADPLTGRPSATRRSQIRRPLRLTLLVVALIASALYLLQDAAPPQFLTGPDLTAGWSAELDLLPTVVVLPFQVLGEDPDQAYLARGLAADLTADLSGLAGLAVIGTSPVSEATEQHAGTPGNARYRVWGGVRRTGGHILIEVRLTETATGRQLWAERYDRPYSDLFAVQDEIGTRVAETLAVRVTAAERQRLAHRFSRSVEAYDLFLRAQERLLVRQDSENGQARVPYRRALAMDPAFARAYGGLALTFAADFRNQWSDDGEASLRRALEMAQTAVEIDPSLPEAHWAMGYVHAQLRRHEDALRHLDQALALAPSFADALALQGGIHTYIGQPALSVPLLRRAMRLNPGAGYLYFLLLGRAYFFLDDFEQALINLREAISRNPASLEAHVYQAAALVRIGDQDGAGWEAEEIRAIAPDFSPHAWLATYPMTDAGQREQLVSVLGTLDI